MQWEKRREILPWASYLLTQLGFNVNTSGKDAVYEILSHIAVGSCLERTRAHSLRTRVQGFPILIKRGESDKDQVTTLQSLRPLRQGLGPQPELALALRPGLPRLLFGC